ncbi:MAG: SufS family cysteine desulfurase [Bacteroidota bacterium]
MNPQSSLASAVSKFLFPIFDNPIDNKPLVYLDNAATTQKPHTVINAISNYYAYHNASVHRGAHTLANTATRAMENVRIQLQHFLHTHSSQEIIFTSGTTQSLNLIAQSYGTPYLKAHDEIWISPLAHHSSLLPWKKLCATTGAKLKKIPLTQTGTIDLEALKSMFSHQTKIVIINYVSNLIGNINPVKAIAHLAQRHNAITIVDAAQAVAHLEIDVQDLGCDFLAFSGHKMYGPTGIGVLYGRTKLLEKMVPYQLGGGMVRNVESELLHYEKIPHRFEAGTPHTAGIVGLGAAIKFLNEVDHKKLQQHEQDLLAYMQAQLNQLPHIATLPSQMPKVGIVSFNIKGIHPLDVGMRLNASGIAVRTGHHCVAPLINQIGLTDLGTVRVSLACYNDAQDIDTLIEALKKMQ